MRRQGPQRVRTLITADKVMVKGLSRRVSSVIAAPRTVNASDGVARRRRAGSPEGCFRRVFRPLFARGLLTIWSIPAADVRPFAMLSAARIRRLREGSRDWVNLPQQAAHGATALYSSPISGCARGDRCDSKD
jgi:hypothetical protein